MRRFEAMFEGNRSKLNLPFAARIRGTRRDHVRTHSSARSGELLVLDVHLVLGVLRIHSYLLLRGTIGTPLGI